MRLGLDARTIYSNTRRGIGATALRLYQELARIRPHWQIYAYHRAPAISPGNSPGSDPGNTPRSLTSNTPANAPAGDGGVFRLDADDASFFPDAQQRPPDNFVPRCVEMVGDRFDAWLNLRMPLAARLDGCDLLHFPANDCPPWPGLPSVVTLHDLIPLDLPHTQTPAQLGRFRKSLRHARRSADRVFCPSQYTRDQLIAQQGFDPQRVSVLPWAVDLPRESVDAYSAMPLLEKLGIRPPFVLHFGAADPRKNTRQLIDAWALLRSQVRRGWSLLIVGLDDASRFNHQQTINRLGLGGSIALAGYLPQPTRDMLLQAASILAYPSAAEGFGLPILEGYAAGAAVLCGRNTSQVELAADAAVMVDTVDLCDLIAGLTRLMRDSQLRQSLVEAGQAQVRQYQWRQTAEQFAQCVEALAAGRLAHAA